MKSSHFPSTTQRFPASSERASRLEGGGDALIRRHPVRGRRCWYLNLGAPWVYFRPFLLGNRCGLRQIRDDAKVMDFGYNGQGSFKGIGNANEETTTLFIFLRSHCPTLAHGIVGRRWSYKKCLIRLHNWASGELAVDG